MKRRLLIEFRFNRVILYSFFLTDVVGAPFPVLSPFYLAQFFSFPDTGPCSGAT
jgi:hypothetical protein